jgi:serine protease
MLHDRRQSPGRRTLAAAGLGTLLAAGALLAIAPAAVLAASTLNVPAAYPTIQSAIAAATDGDTVLVAPGTYPERIDFVGKDITVQSSGGRAVTIIDGGAAGVVVKMVTDPGETPTLRGFTIRNGGEGADDDGGIDTSGGPALIEDNLVTGNTFCDGGGI